MSQPSDIELMLQVQRDEPRALAVLFERYHAQLYRYCLRLTGNPTVSEDLVQDVFMRMLKHRAGFKPETGFAPWMFRIARNAGIDHLRRPPRDNAEIPDEQLLPGDEDAPDEQAEHDESVRLLRRALLRLPLDRREVLLLSRFEFKKYDEVARLLGCSVSAVKVRAHRAIKQLRKIYQELENEAAT